MPVTELALLRLKTQEPSASLKNSLHEAREAQTKWSKYPVRFYRQVEDSAYFYLSGGWNSVEAHCGEWIISETNQKALGQLKDDIDIEWMFHLDIDPSTFNSKIPYNAPVIAISRYFVEANRKTEFDSIMKAGVPHLERYTTPFTYSGGWRIDKEGEDEEFVLFSGWNKVEDHFGFASSEAFEEFGKIKNALKGADIKHVRIEKWE
ncbi:hypothetical protein N7462_010877 [Penicillium macrosclerotiorum]|uniref:uncharacterized protein n=1 Tax=Penicillium macrosclerotiorum TaxID=303699 RepID=UPI002546E729|nr:uncharacterized protein N7462_010877 [Penicillium macrosclerotiorum]KAJ5669807.1 hypothetical protein N7462_010877 [Penicillium macrosclerotiorum]